MLPHFRFSLILKSMEVHLTPEQEEQLAQIASKFIGEEEMDARLEAMFKA